MSALSIDFRNDILIITLNDASLDDQVKATRIGEQLQTCIGEATGGKMLLNFEHVTFMSSVMVGQLFLVHRKSKASGVQLKMCNVAELIQGIFDIVRMKNFVEVYHDEAAALESFHADGKATVPHAGEDLDQVRVQAEQGQPAAQFELARCLEEGAGVPQSSYEALGWFRKAAQQGHAAAQYRCGTAYAYGIDVGQDYQRAMQWYEKAAEQGHAEAQYSLGMTYRYGIAGVEDPQAAIQWYQKAAAQGHEKAQEELENAQ